MPIELHPKEALITAAKTAKRPIAFLVGSPLSADGTGGVPGVVQMLDLVRNEIRGTAASELSRFEKDIDGKVGAEAYQAAMRWLQGNLTQDAVNRAIEQAILRARNVGAPTAFEHDGNPSDWQLPTGTRQLAELTCRDMERFPGPILTTNFDPLISLAIRASGGKPRLRVIDSDGALTRTVETEPGVTQVVHLHGYWRGSDTLHTPAQLTSLRPKLKMSLQGVLRQRTLIVAGYGGWDDAFSSALAELLNDEEAQLNVLWCFYENDSAIIEARYKRLLDRVTPAISRGRFLTYGGIDCHSIFAAIGGFSAASSTAAPIPNSPLGGWARIDRIYLDSLAPLRPEEAIRYFDGAQPTWRHAISDAIPRRQFVSKIADRLNNCRSSKEDSSLQLIRAAGGEGKSTLLLQAAVDPARSGDWNVLWRPSSQIGIAPEDVANLHSGQNWLIVADEAENLVHSLSDCARLLHASGRTNVHFLLATRDVDWRAAGGDRQGLESRLKLQPPILLRGITPSDAEALVTAWGKYGAAALKGLSKLPSAAKQVEALVEAVKDASNQRDEGSLFGGLLTVRFDEDGLRAHVREFLARLRDVKIVDSDHSLFDSVLYVAACHAVGIPGIEENVLADLVSVPRDWIQSRVVRPLGEETAVAPSGGHVFTRHGKVAAAVLIESEQAFGVDLAEVWSAIVRQTVRTSRTVRVGNTHPMILHAGPRLQRALPNKLTNQRRSEIAIAAAETAVAHQTQWLGCVVDLGKTYRFAGNFTEAIKVFRDNLSKARSKVDFSNVIRGYWYEWSVCEGGRDDSRDSALKNAWLGSFSLSDHLKPAPITVHNVDLSCAGLGVAFGNLAEPTPSCVFARARRAVSFLGKLTNASPKGAGYFAKHDREADRMGTPQPRDIDEAVTWLMNAIVVVGQQLQDPFMKNFVRIAMSSIGSRQVSFSLLRKSFEV